jgi:hypothetical protein
MGQRFQEETHNQTKYIRSKDSATFEKTVKAAELFQKHALNHLTTKPLLSFTNGKKEERK